MSLGGYKFAGYKYQWDGVASDDEISLLIHKTRLKAFTEACSKSSSDWHFCKNGGTIDFESNAGVIYKLYNVDGDFISFFQYKNENKYIAIMTIPRITASLFCTKSRGQGWYTQNTNKYIWDQRTTFHCASVTPFNEVDFWLSNDTYPSGALPMIPTSCFNVSTSSTVTSYDSEGSFIYQTKLQSNFDVGYIKLYFGYAVKEDRVIHINTTTCDDNTHTATQIDCGEIAFGVIGFDAMKLSSPRDNYNLFHALLTKQRESIWENSNLRKTSEFRINGCVQTLTSSGSMYATPGKPSVLYLSTACPAGFVYGISESVPYAANFITESENGGTQWEIRTSGDLLNSDGNFTKGIIDIDLIASNNTDGYASLNRSGAYSNSNYILACKDFGGNMQTYVGWDPSNPDITQDSSWIRYTE